MSTNLQKERLQFQLSGKRLRRAKNLYAAFIRKACEQDQAGSVLFDCAKKAIKRGLYAALTGERSVRFSLVRRFWQHHPEYLVDRHMFGWHRYVRDFGWDVPGSALRRSREEKAA